MSEGKGGPGGDTEGERKREGKREMGSDRLSERKSRKAERRPMGTREQRIQERGVMSVV